MSSELTRERILDAAEELFAEDGFAATSVRAITSRAAVNLAALNYHFGSKEALVDAVFERRVGPLNSERLRLLDEIEARSGADRLALEEVLAAFLGPAIRLACEPESGGEKFMRLMGRFHSESGTSYHNMVVRLFKTVLVRFERAFERALPELPLEELFWRIQFVVGAMAHTMAHALKPAPLEALEEMGLKSAALMSRQGFSSKDADEALNRLIQFSAAGLRAAIPVPQEVGPQ